MLFLVLILVATALIFILVYKRDVNYNYGATYDEPKPGQALLPPGPPADMNELLYPKKPASDDQPSA
jgi:hypothetical protein